MDTDSVSCRLFKIHKYKKIYEDEKYYIEQCSVCNIYKVIFKTYSIKSKYKVDELPSNLIEVLV